MNILKRILHIFFVMLVVIAVIISIVDYSYEYSKAAKSGEGIEFALLPIVAAFWGVIIASEISLWVSTARIISDLRCKKWFWTAYDSIAALLAFAAGYTMILYRIEKNSNQTSEIALYALGGAITLQVIGLIVRAGNDLKRKEK